MKYYLAGPMSNYPAFNFPLFDKVAIELRKQGYDIVSPAELDDLKTRNLAMASPDGSKGSASPNGETWMDFLMRDLKIVADEVDGVIVLPEWENSRGARLETYTAYLCNKPIFAYLDGYVFPLGKFELENGWIH